ncbi:SapC family protein [Sphingomonas quercus]|uniref:SapC family protein n=1 Tax=Sphingomonas quercus TaxID=2842451 RepID=A0ABS6BN35_9SPHN|nr:SapC family protein [Sphingomonas quercus]MBU3079272.1 SapC family protein [Sphingomonas quercus]
MASNPQSGLPLFYNGLEPLSSQQHAEWKSRRVEGAPFLVGAHAIPVTVEEIPTAQRYFPIVFSSGPDAVPLALMGLNEGVNTFVDEAGKLTDNVYVPAYARRYPWMLARLSPNAQDLSLCFDPTTEVIGPFEDGEPLFVDGQPTDEVKNILGFCEQFEMAGQRTAAFMKELTDQKLLIDGEFTIQQEGYPQPFVYRGFQMVSEEALQNLRGDVARKMVQSGMMAVIFAHLFSLQLIREVFARQIEQGKLPPQQLPVAPL